MKRKHESKLEMIIIKKRKVNRNIYNQDGRGLQTNCIWFYGTYVLGWEIARRVLSIEQEPVISGFHLNVGIMMLQFRVDF